MTDKSPVDVLEHLPKKTPIWAVGLVTVIVSLATSFVGVYIFIKDEVSRYTTSAQEIHKIEATTKAKSHELTLDAVVSLVQTNSVQIVELSKALGNTQHENAALADRITSLEKTVAALRGTLEECEYKLKKCESRK